MKRVAVLSGAGDRSRTYDLLITNELLYQLSYTGFYKSFPCHPWRYIGDTVTPSPHFLVRAFIRCEMTLGHFGRLHPTELHRRSLFKSSTIINICDSMAN